MKIEIWFSERNGTHYCGIGDGVIDGLFVSADTKEGAALAFIEKYNKDEKFTFSEMPQTETGSILIPVKD